MRCALLPKRPAGHWVGATAPSPQKPPLPHGWQAAASVPPRAELKEPARHDCCVLLVLLAGQKCPLAQGPEHCAEPSPCEAPYVPAGQLSGSTAPLTQ